MNPAVLTLHLLNFGFIALLPALCFRADGTFNLMWCLTAAPFALSALWLVACRLALLAPWVAFEGTTGRGLALVAVALAAGSMALIAYTLGTHRRPLALWHQTNDAPERIVTEGAYTRIRHPFYAAFLLALLAAAVSCPAPGTVLAFLYGVFILNHTAAREEKKLAASPFCAEYEAYRARTGRFVPRLGSRPS